MLSAWANKQKSAGRCVERSLFFFFTKLYNKIQPVYVTIIWGRREGREEG